MCVTGGFQARPLDWSMKTRPVLRAQLLAMRGVDATRNMYDFSDLEPDSLLLRDDWLRALAMDLADADAPPNGSTLAAWRIAMQTATPKTGRLLTLFGRRRVIRSPKGRRIVGAGERAYEGLPTDEADVSDRLMIKRRVVGAVFALSEPYRTTVLLHYVFQLDIDEIAANTAASAGAVESRLRRGRKRIGRRLGGTSAAVQERVFDLLLKVSHWPLGHRPQSR